MSPEPTNGHERRPAAKGWCPGAHRPMPAGDGLLVRVRPRLARLSLAQASGLCDLAQSLGSGYIELTNRANLQLRAIAPEHHGRTVEVLCELGLLDTDATLETRAPVLVQPCWQPGDASEGIATELAARLGELPVLDPKFGFAVDAGPAPLLARASADVRIERAGSGRLIVRADGADRGLPVEPKRAVDAALRLAAWFARSAAGSGAGRMRAYLCSHALPEDFVPREPAGPFAEPPAPGVCDVGSVYGVPFGQVHASALVELLRRTQARALRVTPFRSLILEGAAGCESEGFISRADDALLGVDACPGAPACASATVHTRSLAREFAVRLQTLAPQARPSLHVSGCAKGCARSHVADITLVGRAGAFDVVLGGRAWDAPSITGQSPQDLRATRWSF